MNALKPRAPFQVLIMSEESRLGREAIETAYALKQLVQAGVRVFFYLEDRERTLDSPTDKIMLSLTTFADELEREKARQRTYDAMLRKAKAGYVTGGACFGYRNVEIRDADGTRSHVTREIEPTEANVIRRIFQLSAAGHGVKAIASSSTRRAHRRHGRSVDDRRPGRRRRSARSCTAPSIGVTSCGVARRSATPGDASISVGSRRRPGFGRGRLRYRS
jgi:DNA invertase Pin-like site-specific DNA recombinase